MSKEINTIETDDLYEIADAKARKYTLNAFVLLTDFGADPTGATDSTEALKNAISYSVSVKRPLLVNGFFMIGDTILNDVKDLCIYGGSGITPSTLDEITIQNGFKITGQNGIALTGISSLTFKNISFYTETVSTKCLDIRSFANRIESCNFYGFEFAIKLGDGEVKNFCGENFIINNHFSGNETCIYGDNKRHSDGYIIDNIFNDHNNKSIDGMFPGYIISRNHVYSKYPAEIGYFNTLISNNYLQQRNNGAIRLGKNLGDRGCIFNGNQIEISSNVDEKNFGLITILNGAGNININGNSVHGKDYTQIANMAFIDMVKNDVIIWLGDNTTSVCGALYNTPPKSSYDSGGTYFANNVTVNGTLEKNTAENFCVKDGIFAFDFIITNITNANVFSLGAMQVPCQIRMFDMEGSYSNTIQYSGGFVNIPTFSSIKKLRVTGIGLKPINYLSTRKFKL